MSDSYKVGGSKLNPSQIIKKLTYNYLIDASLNETYDYVYNTSVMALCLEMSSTHLIFLAQSFLSIVSWLVISFHLHK